MADNKTLVDQLINLIANETEPQANTNTRVAAALTALRDYFDENIQDPDEFLQFVLQTKSADEKRIARSNIDAAQSGGATGTLKQAEDAIAQKQNSLAVDGTGTKYPTVDAINEMFFTDSYPSLAIGAIADATGNNTLNTTRARTGYIGVHGTRRISVANGHKIRSIYGYDRNKNYLGREQVDQRYFNFSEDLNEWVFFRVTITKDDETKFESNEELVATNLVVNGISPDLSKEENVNKQNSLDEDGTGSKYPTVDAINTEVVKSELISEGNKIHQLKKNALDVNPKTISDAVIDLKTGNSLAQIQQAGEFVDIEKSENLEALNGAIRFVWVENANPSFQYQIANICKNDPTRGAYIYIAAVDKVTGATSHTIVIRNIQDKYDKDKVFKIDAVGGSGNKEKIHILIDWSKIHQIEFRSFGWIKWVLNDRSLAGYPVNESDILSLVDTSYMELIYGKNLFDITAVKEGKRLDPTSGGIGTQSAYAISDYIPVQEGKTYIKSGLGRKVYTFFKNIGDTASVIKELRTAEDGIINVPVGVDANYLVLEVTSNKANLPNYKIQIEEGTVATEWVPYEAPVYKIKKSLLPETTTSDPSLPTDSYDSLDFSLREKYKKAIQKARVTENTVNLNKTLGNIVTDSVSKEISISNPYNEDVTNALAILHLHYGNNEVSPANNHVFLNGASRKDFTDIRFSLNGQRLTHKIASCGNYELIPDDRVQGNVFCFEGELIYGNRGDLFLSTDNLETNTTIATGYIEPIGINSLGDVFYQRDRLTGKIFRRTRASSYEVEDIVLDTMDDASFHRSSFNMTNTGTLLAGRYQDAFNSEIFRSTDNGNTWTKVFDNKDKQHIHSIIVDRETNYIYANVDGRISGDPTAMMALFRSVDDGASWVQIENPFPTDYGVIASRGKWSYGGGEGAVKGTPTVYRRDNATNKVTNGFDNFCNSQKAYVIGDKIIVIGGGHSSHNQSKLFIADWGTLDFKELYNSSHIDSRVMNRSFRYGSKEEACTPNGDEEQLFLTHNYERESSLSNLRFYNGGDHWSAMVYVSIPFLPKEGLNITLETGNIGIVDSTEIFSREEPLFELKLNEGTDYVFDNNGKEYDVSGAYKAYSGGVRFGSCVPREREYLEEGAYRGFDITIDEINMSNKSLSFWGLSSSGVSHTTSKKYLFRGPSLEVYINWSGLVLKVDGVEYTTTTHYSTPTASEKREFLNWCYTFGEKTKLYMNGYLLQEWDVKVNSSITNILSMALDAPENLMKEGTFVTGVRIFDRELDRMGVLREYNGGVYL